MSEPVNDLAKKLAWVADRGEHLPGVMAYVLRRYAALEGLADVAAVGAWLGTTDAETLARLRLCRVPTGDAVATGADEIAGAFGLDGRRLVTMLRRVAAADAMAAGGSSLLAARRDENDTEKGDG